MDDSLLSELGKSLVKAMDSVATSEHPEETADNICRTLNTFANVIHRVNHEGTDPGSK